MYSFLRCEYVHTLVTLARPFISLACPPPSSPDYERKRFSSLFFAYLFPLCLRRIFHLRGLARLANFFLKDKNNTALFLRSRGHVARTKSCSSREREWERRRNTMFCAATAVSSLANACASSSSSKINSTNPTSRKKMRRRRRDVRLRFRRVSRCSSSKKDNGHRRSGGGGSSGGAVSADRPG